MQVASIKTTCIAVAGSQKCVRYFLALHDPPPVIVELDVLLVDNEHVEFRRVGGCADVVGGVSEVYFCFLVHLF